jgi:hypothetical protein
MQNDLMGECLMRSVDCADWKEDRDGVESYVIELRFSYQERSQHAVPFVCITICNQQNNQVNPCSRHFDGLANRKDSPFPPKFLIF